MSVGTAETGSSFAAPPPSWVGRLIAIVTSPRVGAVVVCLAALAVRLSFVGSNPRGDVAYDESYYDGLAVNVLAGRGYRLDGVNTTSPDAYETGPTAIMAPGYPAFLAAVYLMAGRNLDMVVLLQAVIGAATCVVVYAVARSWHIGPSDELVPLVALAAGLLAAFSRVLTVWSRLILSENLAVPLLLLAVWWLHQPVWRRRWANAVAVAVLLGLTVHVRSELALAVPIAVLWIVLVAPRIRDWRRTEAAWRPVDAAVLILVFAATLVPWTVRNRQALGGWIFIRSFSGPVLYYANNESLPSAWAMAQGETGSLDPGVADLPAGDELALDRYLRDRALAFVRAHPDRVAQAAAVKSATFWRPIGSPWLPSGGVLGRILPGALAFWLSVAGLFVGLRTAPRSALVYGLLLAEAAFIAFFGAWERERFRTPFYALELVLLAAGLVWLIRLVAVTARGVADGGRRSIGIRRAATTVGAAALVLAFVVKALSAETVAAHAGFDGEAALAGWQILQARPNTATIDNNASVHGGGSLRVTSDPPAGWQDLQLRLPPDGYAPSHPYRVTFWGRTNGASGGQVYPLIPATGDSPTVGLGRYTFGGTEWNEHSFFFFTPFDGSRPLAIYVSNEDYTVPDATVWIDDLTVYESNWPRYLWEGYVRGSW